LKNNFNNAFAKIHGFMDILKFMLEAIFHPFLKYLDRNIWTEERVYEEHFNFRDDICSNIFIKKM
jgi:hypothetical protein